MQELWGYYKRFNITCNENTGRRRKRERNRRDV